MTLKILILHPFFSPSYHPPDEALHVYKGHQFCPGSRRMQLSVPCLHGSDAPQSIAASEQTSEQQTVDAGMSVNYHWRTEQKYKANAKGGKYWC